MDNTLPGLSDHFYEAAEDHVTSLENARASIARVSAGLVESKNSLEVLRDKVKNGEVDAGTAIFEIKALENRYRDLVRAERIFAAQIEALEKIQND